MHQISVRNCGLDALAHVLASSEALRAVSVSFHEGRLEYATAGQQSGEKAGVEVAEAVRGLQGASVCRWDAKSPRCSACGRLFDGEWEEGVLIRRAGEKIVLERESCPTAPKFWLWRMLSGVKLEVRQLPSVVGAGKKWKVPLGLALACGMAGLLGWRVEGWMGRIFFFYRLFGGRVEDRGGGVA